MIMLPPSYHNGELHRQLIILVIRQDFGLGPRYSILWRWRADLSALSPLFCAWDKERPSSQWLRHTVLLIVTSTSPYLAAANVRMRSMFKAAVFA
ncbi:hypothetical protein K449DRAFT_389269 [Hypoxylon sp. EC38]|nr:hypothetical protein K449DRAFT_389269 [Hypoxylon sp. EC38]